MGALLRDFRYAARALRAQPGFTVAAVLTMAIGVGATAAIFSIVNTVLYRPLPFANADRLVAIGSTTHEAPGRLRTVSLEDVRDWQRQSRTIAAFAAWRDWGMARGDGPGRESVYAAIVTPDVFQVLTVKPVAGRLFQPDDDRVGRNQIVLLTYNYWRERFGGDPAAVGRTMVLERGPKATYTIAGVLPPEFNGTPSFEDVQVLALSSIDPDAATRRDLRNRFLFARLTDGASINNANAEMALIAAQLARQYPATDGQRSARVASLIDYEVGPMAATLRAFFVAVGFVLMIACANVSALQLARALARRREFSIRRALGGSRFTIGRALVAESVLVSLVGGVAGLFLASWLVDVVLAVGPAIARAAVVRLDSMVFLAALATCLAAGLVLALPASLLTTRVDVVRALKEESGQVANAPVLRMRMAFVAAQIALAVMLLAGAVVAGQTLTRQLTLRPGFEPEGLATTQVSPSLAKYPKGEQVAALYARLLEEIRAVPGVRAASAVSAAPLSGEGAEPVDFTVGGGTERVTANSFNVAPGYFRTLGAPIRFGREFTDADTAASPAVAVVNESFVRSYLQGGEALNARIRLSNTNDVVTVVGVVGDLLQNLTPRASAEPEIYWPYAQRPRWASIFVVRADDPGTAMAAARQRMQAVDGELRVGAARLMTERISRSSRGPRFTLLLFGLFAGVALLLSATGVYGLVSYASSQRAREIGVRVSLGATPRDVFRLVAASGFATVLAGRTVGLAGTMALAGPLGAFLPQLDPLHPFSMAIAWVLLVAVGWVACYLPSRRALALDPVDALRLP